MKLGKHMLWLALLAAAAVVLGPEALAQEAAKEPEAESLWKLISYGGTVGYITIFINFVGYAFVIEHFINVKRDVLMPPEMVEQVDNLLEEGEMEEALQLCESQPNYYCRVIAAALQKAQWGYGDMVGAAERANDDEAVKLFSKIGHINFIATVAPMLGLFGTVEGMMFTFATLANSVEPPTPASMASGIQQSIVTTVIGLVVSIPMGSFFYYFRFKVIQIVAEIQNTWRPALERFREEG